MKKLFILLSLLLLSLTTFSQTDETRSMKMMIDTVSNLVNQIEKSGSEIVKVEVDIVSSHVPKESFRVLTNYWIYKVVVFGDWRIKDIDLQIYKVYDDGSQELIIEDIRKKPSASINLLPDEKARYKFVITGYRFNDGYTSGHYGLIIYHD